MIFKTRPGIAKQFATEHDFGFKNLIVSGCSFTYNNHDTAAVTWPYYLKDLGGFEQVLDSSMPGAGNHHISNSLQWALENHRPDIKDSLVIVMWSGNDRDDYICPRANTTAYPFEFCYDVDVVSGITGGSSADSRGNTNNIFKEFSKTKTAKSRAVENYLHILNLWNYLMVNGYKFVFLDYLDRSVASRTQDFDLAQCLPAGPKTQLDSMITKLVTPHEWAIRHDQLSSDDFHPSPKGYLEWTRRALLPYLKTQID